MKRSRFTAGQIAFDAEKLRLEQMLAAWSLAYPVRHARGSPRRGALATNATLQWAGWPPPLLSLLHQREAERCYRAHAWLARA